MMDEIEEVDACFDILSINHSTFKLSNKNMTAGELREQYWIKQSGWTGKVHQISSYNILADYNLNQKITKNKSTSGDQFG